MTAKLELDSLVYGHSPVAIIDHYAGNGIGRIEIVQTEPFAFIYEPVSRNPRLPGDGPVGYVWRAEACNFEIL